MNSATHRPGAMIFIGAVGGVAWGAGLRAYMIEFAGPASAFTWEGTFGAILLPAAVTGGLLGWAEHLRRTRRRPGRRWLALAPLTLAVAPLLLPGGLLALLTQGLGGGAVVVAIVGMAGGYVLSCR